VNDEPPTANPTQPSQAIDPAARRDIIVGVLLAMFLAALDQTIVAPALPTIGSSLGNAEYLSWIVLELTGVSLAFWVLFGLRIRHCDEPILPTEVLKNPVVATASASNFFSMAVNLGLGVYIPLYLQGVRHLDPSTAGLSLIPLLGSMVCGAAFSGWMTTRLKHYKRVALIGVTTAALALFFAWKRNRCVGFS
jgi:MFS family permease